ncbi:hypothetical protein SCATT_29100 [Streptantibioticus cattleyicolor NRRL 8057 = DSM 46488]|uniref:Uncharacterized protein n=1 Tax=Streptantibioticus cattleyicolor (strain ATCC 35852 / DSM 46488 / JCM 4925 / NBRC 14057 / NRRL 8057) TaxID=1003195 RepID=G8WQR7_STREN|nr:hypothetical protein SCATT_29100 [Streptantibioticus cattleyicolor NRRL 8057 = DSM 46488]
MPRARRVRNVHIPVVQQVSHERLVAAEDQDVEIAVRA